MLSKQQDMWTWNINTEFLLAFMSFVDLECLTPPIIKNKVFIPFSHCLQLKVYSFYLNYKFSRIYIQHTFNLLIVCWLCIKWKFKTLYQHLKVNLKTVFCTFCNCRKMNSILCQKSNIFNYKSGCWTFASTIEETWI